LSVPVRNDSHITITGRSLIRKIAGRFVIMLQFFLDLVHC
jgi:hypothetical protein